MFVYYLQLAWRRCRRQPSAAVLIVLTMAIGIAACMTALAIFAALAGQPLPGVSDHLYIVTMNAQTVVRKNGADYTRPDSLLKLRDAKALVDAGRATTQVALADSQIVVSNPDGRQSDDVSGLLAYGPVLRTLQVPVRFGRSWTAAEQAAHAPVVVVDTHLARKLFGTADAVGRSVEMNHHRFRVIGVTAPWEARVPFIDAIAGGVQAGHVRLFLPVGAALDVGVGPATSGECGAHTAFTFGTVDVHACRWLEVWVTLDSPQAVAAYQRFVSNYADAQHASGRFVYPPRTKLYGTLAWLDLNDVVPADVSLNVILAGAFLFLCMVNVAGLLTARFLRRHVDAAVRRALGASRVQIFAQHLVEAGLFGVLGGVVALPLAALGMWIVRQQPVSYAAAAAFHPGTFLLLFALAVGVGLLVGILPAWRVCRLPPAAQIRQG